MFALRRLSLIVLVLAVMASSVTASVARHQARAMIEVVLCTGYGMVTLALDDQGRPTGPMVPCPDCIPPMAALPDSRGTLVGPASELSPRRYVLRQAQMPVASPPTYHAPRGPPVRI